MVKPPRALLVLGTLAVLIGAGGGSRALIEQVLPYLGSHDAFVSERRHQLELHNPPGAVEVDPASVARAGDALGERAWTRRGIVLPLRLVNLVLSVMLFVGGLRALSGSPWGHGAWQFAVRLSVPYTLVAAVVAFVQARDGWDASVVMDAQRSLLANVPSETLADFDLIEERALICLGAAVMLTYYIGCAIYLRRPRVKALFTVET